MVIPLRKTIENAELAKTVADSISNFTCQDKDVESFLRDKALDFERRDKSRTYLVFDDATDALVAYYTLSLNALPLQFDERDKYLQMVRRL